VSEIRRTALITGGEGDLAKVLAGQLRDCGWVVHAPGRAEMDVTSAQAVQDYFRSLPHLDLLINNAGLVEDSLMLGMSEAQFDRVLDANLSGAFRCARAALETLSQQRSGHIVNVGSFAALTGTLGQANYAAAKAGLIALTKSLAQEYGPQTVRCNCVLPGFLETRMTRDLLEKRRDEVLATHALGRLNTLADAARFIVMLDSMEHISGQIFQLDSRIGPWT
jgi:3-oxoacyl-[acyl-carrier protein] reductase